jgi:predicted peroxiredoxin
MQKWEYLFVFASMTSDAGDFHPRFANGQELVDWQAGPSMYEYANQLGKSGWELLACQPIVFTQSNKDPLLEGQSISSDIRAIEMVFKRPEGGNSISPS